MTMPAFEKVAPPGIDAVSDPYSVYAHLREQRPVHRVPTHDAGDVWLIVGHAEARAALTDPRLRNDIRHSSSWQDDGGNAIGLNMLQTDPPHHTRLRRLVAREFTARRIEALRPRIEQLTNELLDAMLPLGKADLVEAFAMPLPMAVICELLGVPAADRDQFRIWSGEIVFPSSAEAAGAAVHGMTGYLAQLIEGKRNSADEDLLGALVRTMDEDGDSLSPEEMLGMAFLLLVAGHETTVNLISNGTCALLRHPEQLAALRADPALIDDAVEEMLRYDGPSHSTAHRFAAEDVEIAGTVIPAGDPVLVLLAAANRDPDRFPDPDRFDITRDARGHLGFSHGVHHCLGAPLARLEATIALRALLERCPDLALDTDPAALAWRPSLMRGLLHLPVRTRKDEGNAV
ncbi:cytochrome P450 family protein [Streptomyces atriruber]|uniref:cytochrome P450 family protein n=1 Tax=Streptomyces atriruber TaxID=545121 RepID=UPI0006E369C8|nr:cytochrome P450 [Streptomyces atriruber]